MYKHLRTLSLLGLAAFLGACASSNSGDVYTREQTREAQTVKMGTVESVRTVRIEGTKTPIGSGAGAVIGGVAGSSVGGGRGSIIAAVLGAVAGGLAGSAVEEGVTRKEGVEITVTLDKGSTIAVVQEGSASDFQVGDRVRILDADGVTRVTR
ncbi:MAG: glycine zipper 2TM domain-containing protein [Methylobacillus sp.]|jgi:outer membrane lipoprotein SlyB|nr:glycine zipper 2TM domain-containing protein [Methylobacillus sp.]